jgi:hypothetical protein
MIRNEAPIVKNIGRYIKGFKLVEGDIVDDSGGSPARDLHWLAEKIANDIFC